MTPADEALAGDEFVDSLAITCLPAQAEFTTRTASEEMNRISSLTFFFKRIVIVAKGSMRLPLAQRFSTPHFDDHERTGFWPWTIGRCRLEFSRR
jgi:hypothetical protein